MSLARLLRPRSIAVVGGGPVAEVIRQCRRLGFAGRLFAVHPRREAIAGIRCHRRIAELPEPPDCIFLAVHARATVEMVAELSAMGAGGAVAYASGFAETGGAGMRLQEKLVHAAARMPVLGPNCHGFLNYLDGVALWPDQHGAVAVERGVAFLSQSGNIAISLTMQRRGLDLAMVVTLGNQAMLGPSALIEELVGDPRIDAIGLCLERIDDRDRFAAAVAAARSRGKPVAALRLARGPRAREAALSHTASLAGEDAVASAFLSRLGIARVESLPALLECLKILRIHGPLSGRRLVSLSCSGGEAALIADAGARHGLAFPPFSASRPSAIAEALEGRVPVRNPLDYHTFVWNRRERLRQVFTPATGGAVDLALLILDFPRGDRCRDDAWWCAVEAFEEACRSNGTPGAVLATLPECLPEGHAKALAGRGLVPLCGIEEGLAAIAAAVAAATGPTSPPRFLPATVAEGTILLFSEEPAKRMLAGFGLRIPRGRIVRSVEEALAAARDLGVPLVAKCSGADLAHKSEHGGVRLGLREEAEVATVVAELLDLSPAVLLEHMVEDGVAELILGLGRDPEFGLYLLLGSGGVLAELVGDRAVLPLPAAATAIGKALRGLRVWPLLEGHRGRPPGDLAALLEAVAAVQRFAEARAPSILELDINPLIVRPPGRGAVAVDALLRIITSPETEDVDRAPDSAP